MNILRLKDPLLCCIAALIGHSAFASREQAYDYSLIGGLDKFGISVRGVSANSLSLDGLVVVGSFDGLGADNIVRTQAYRGIAGSDAEKLGDLSGGSFRSSAYAVSGDGSVVVGSGISENGYEAFRWTEAGGMVGLGDLEGSIFYSLATNVSADGQVVIGHSVTENVNEAFRWTEETGIQSLGEFEDGGFMRFAKAVSTDGSTIYGLGNEGEFAKWTLSDGLTRIKDREGNYLTGFAYEVSSDDSFVVGNYSTNLGFEAFKWSEETGMVGLGDFDGGRFASNAFGVSKNGRVIVGRGNSDSGYEAFRWTENTGLQRISEWLADSGVTVGEGFELTAANDVSDDGSVVIGNGTFERADIAWLARASSGLISLNEFTQSFGTTSSVWQTSLALPNTIMNGSHHRTLMEQDFLDQNQMVWVSGDFAAHDRRDADIWVGEVGCAYDFSQELRGGIGIGYGKMEQDLTFDGSHELDGQYILGELDYQIPDTQLIVSLLGIYGDWDADIERGYTNGGNLDKSRGSTDVETVSARIRVDWVDAFDLLGWSFSPRVAFSVTRIETDSYTETGGGFPASFDSMSHTAEEFRFGLTGERMLTEKTTVRGIFEAVHRVDEDNDDFSGEVIGLFDFSIPGASNDQDWIRGGAEVSHKITGNQMLTATIFGATRGEDPEMTIGLNYQWLF